MAIARKHLIDKERPGYYLLSNRCVRQGLHLGEGPVNEYLQRERKVFVEELLVKLCFVFMVRLLTWSLMNNHYHLVLFFNPKRVKKLSDQQIAELVLALDVKSPQRSDWDEKTRKRWLEQFVKNKEEVRKWRSNLSDPSKFMAYFDEVIARNFNKLDKCKGHFWQDRFHSLKLEDRAAVMMAMSYVDLNPVRAGASMDLIRSHHTAISHRIRANCAGELSAEMDRALEPRAVELNKSLCPMEELFEEIEWPVLPVGLGEYVEMLDDMGRLLKEGKGSLKEETAETLRQMGLNPESWEMIMNLEKNFRNRVGSREALESEARDHERSHYQGISKADRLYL
jgi:putative transposase